MTSSTHFGAAEYNPFQTLFSATLGAMYAKNEVE